MNTSDHFRQRADRTWRSGIWFALTQVVTLYGTGFQEFEIFPGPLSGCPVGILNDSVRSPWPWWRYDGNAFITCRGPVKLNA